MNTAASGSAEDRFKPGVWEMEGWLEVEGRSETAARQTDRVTVTPQMAAFPARTVMFSTFYRGLRRGEVMFERGIISGHVDQQAVAPFPAHQQAVTGTYSADAFEIRIVLPAIGGVQSYQFVKGRLVKPD